MNKSESKYFNTAVRMDEALLCLLEKKDFEYITVKEICHTAGVNRSTFYLHYETIGDLLEESIQYLYDQFLQHMNRDSKEFIQRIHDCPETELYLVTPEYLRLYLEYMKKNQRLFRVAARNPSVLRLDETYERLFRHVFDPILARFHIPSSERGYRMAFYVQGLMAIVQEWLKNDCRDPIDQIISVMQQCVMPERSLPDQTNT